MYVPKGVVMVVFEILAGFMGTLQEVQLREVFRPMKIGCDVGDVGESVMVRFHQHVEAPVVTAGV